MFYCPRCATPAAPGQRHCKNCGIKLDVIQDAIEGRQRSSLDFETLKKDLRDLGASLRTGFEEASIKIKQTQKLGKNPGRVGQPAALNLPNWSKEFDRALRKVKAAHTRKYSLQQATLSFFGGGAIMTVWYFLLKAAVESGLLQNLELLILDLTGTRVAGLAQFVSLLWLLGFIPIAHGVAHLANAIFFAPGKIGEPQEQIRAAPQEPVYSSPVAPSTSDLPDESEAPRPSVTEEETVRFEQR